MMRPDWLTYMFWLGGIGSGAHLPGILGERSA